MAVRNYGGFGQGLAQGFGLVQGIYDRQDRKDLAERQLEADAARDEATARYRQQDLLGNQQYREDQAQRASDERIATAGFRRQSLQHDAADQARDDKQDADELAWKKNPNNPTNQNATANLIAAERERDRDIAYAGRVNKAGALNKIYNYYQSGTEATPEQLAEISELMTETEGSMFDAAEMVSFVNQRAGQEIQAFTQQLATGVETQMSPTLTRAVDRSMGISKTAALGKRVDDTFVNAPAYMKDGNHTIVGQMLYKVNATQGQPVAPGSQPDVDVTGTMAVLARNERTGKTFPYFPEITDKRAPYQTEAAVFKFGEAAQGTMAGAYMNAEVGPKIKPLARRSRILTRFGDPEKRTDGTAAFNQAVDEQVKIVRQAIQGGGSPSAYVMYVSGDEAAPMLNKTMTEQQVAMVRSRVEDNLLFDTVATPPQQFVNDWLNQTSQDLSALDITSLKEQRTFTAAHSNLQDADKITLGDLVDFSNASPQVISNYAGIVENPRQLAAYLKEMGFIE